MNYASTTTFVQWGYPGLIAVAVVLLAITALVSFLVVRFVRKVLHLTTNGEVGGSIIANIIRVVIWALGISLVLKECLGMDPSVIWGALGVSGIALSLGLQNTISNLIGGLQLSLSRDVSVGDWVIIGSNAPAKVIDINWRMVKLKDENGIMFLVPNSVLNTTTVQVLPEPYTIYFALALASDIDLDEVKTEIVRIAYENLRQADMNYGETVPLLSVTGSTVDSITARLKVYALRSYTQIQIDNVVMPPVLDYLKSIGGLAHCYSGK